MLIFTRSLRVCLAVEPVDLRKSFEGLSALVKHTLEEDERSSQVFAFSNKRRDRVRLLYWDGTGLWLLTKRLEAGSQAPVQPPIPVATAAASRSFGDAFKRDRSEGSATAPMV